MNTCKYKEFFLIFLYFLSVSFVSTTRRRKGRRGTGIHIGRNVGSHRLGTPVRKTYLNEKLIDEMETVKKRKAEDEKDVDNPDADERTQLFHDLFSFDCRSMEKEEKTVRAGKTVL